MAKGKLIEIVENQDRPKIICGHCKRQILIDITPFQKDVAKFMVDKCPLCGGEIFVALLILCDISPQNLAHCVQACVNALTPASKIIGGKRTP